MGTIPRLYDGHSGFLGDTMNRAANKKWAGTCWFGFDGGSHESFALALRVPQYRAKSPIPQRRAIFDSAKRLESSYRRTMIFVAPFANIAVFCAYSTVIEQREVWSVVDVEFSASCLLFTFTNHLTQIPMMLFPIKRLRFINGC